MPTEHQPTTTETHSVSTATYWRSLEEYAQSPALREAIEKEFPGYDPEDLLSLGRRRFMQLAGASMALAGLTLAGCRRWPKEQVLPYNSRPDGTMPGVPEKYASMLERNGVARGLFVTSFDGRPLGVDGSPLDPTVGNPEAFAKLVAAYNKSGSSHDRNRMDSYVGVADTFAQAMTLEMYDPDRARTVMKTTAGGDGGFTTERSSWETFSRAVHFDGNVAVLAEPMSGPTAAAVKRAFEKKHGSGSWHTWTPLNRDTEIAGSTLAFGSPRRAHYDVARAKVIACFDSDFLSDHPTATRNARGWAKGRRSADRGLQKGTSGQPSMNRLYSAAPTVTSTAAAADVAVQVKPSKIAAMLDRLAGLVGVPGIESHADLNGETGFVEQLAAELKANAGASIVVAGPNQPAEVHALMWAINATLRNLGKTVQVTEDPTDTLAGASLASLIEKLNAGKIDTLLILGGNPVFDAPADSGFAEALANAETAVHLGLYFDETSAACGWHLPMAHTLEAWGDGRAWDGTLLLQQPLIEPLFGGKSAIEVAAMAAGEHDAAGYDLVRRAWTKAVGGTSYNAGSHSWDGALSGIDAEKNWRGFLHDGLVPGSAFAPQSGKLKSPRPAASAVNAAGEGQVEVAFQQGPAFDGRYANNGWLQEVPQPMTKVTWDTPALVSIPDAKALKLQNGDHVSVGVGDQTVDLPCYIMPGQPKGVVVLRVGGGRTVCGNVGTDVGHNVYPLRTASGAGFAAATLAKAKGHTPLATTTHHQLIDPDRVDGKHHGTDNDIAAWAIQKRAGKRGTSGYQIKEATLAEYINNPHFAHKGEHGDVRLQLFDSPTVLDDGGYVQPNPDGPDAFNVPHAWGMSVDMASCIGCNACVVACQAENNIPIVGKDQVLKSREMHWIRIDTYFKGNPEATSTDDLQAVHMPVACLQCENAPCEQVCPVAATVHDAEGLNTMVYNRCIGTRYCSNNCPYKVRRFNYFDFHSKLDGNFFRSKNVGVEVQNKPWLALPDMQQGDMIDQVRRMMFNPEVTVRMRGVMEKCTYCTQRIARAKINNKADWARRKTLGESPTAEDRLVTDGEVRTACQTACPTEAIVFGDLNVADSAVSKLQQKNPRSFALLDELNTRPRTQYLAKISNPAKADAKADAPAHH